MLGSPEVNCIVLQRNRKTTYTTIHKIVRFRFFIYFFKRTDVTSVQKTLHTISAAIFSDPS